MATAGDLVDAAYKEIGELGASETLSGDESADGLTWLNRLLDRLAAERLSIYTETRTTFAITASDGTYTIGASGDITSVARPVFIRAVSYSDSAPDPDQEYQLYRLTEDEYVAESQKARTSTYPESFYYNPTYPNGTITLLPTPTATTLTLVIYAPTAVTSFAALSTTVSLPPGYEEMLVTNLALSLCPSFSRQPHPVLVKRAADSLATVKRANFRPSLLKFPPDSLIGGSYSPAYDIKRG